MVQTFLSIALYLQDSISILTVLTIFYPYLPQSLSTSLYFLPNNHALPFRIIIITACYYLLSLVSTSTTNFISQLISLFLIQIIQATRLGPDRFCCNICHVLAHVYQKLSLPFVGWYIFTIFRCIASKSLKILRTTLLRSCTLLSK